MKKIVKLTESDLTRIVRRVIKEQEDNMGDDAELLEMNPLHFLIKGADERAATFILNKYIRENKNTVRFIAILDCEGIDFSGIDFCEFTDLVLVNLTGTPNNFEETQGDCYKKMSDNMYDFMNP